MSQAPLFYGFAGKIIWSADGLRPSQIIDIIKCPNFPKEKVAIKLNPLFFTRYHPRHIEIFQERHGVPVFVDPKIIGIPTEAAEIAKCYLEYHPWMLSVMAGACSSGLPCDDFLHTFAGLCLDVGTLPCIVTVLTSKTVVMIREEYGLSLSDNTSKPVEFYADLAKECGLTDVVCSPLEIAAVKKYGLSINTPGVRLSGDSHDDQARVDTPASAIKNGANRLVIGRSIYNPAKDKVEDVPKNIQRILDEINAVSA